MAQRFRPFEPRPSGVVCVQGAEQRVVREPTGFAFNVLLESRGSRRADAPFGLLEARERLPQRQLFQLAHAGVVDCSRRARSLEPLAKFGLEPGLAANGFEILEVAQADELR